jgi:hypothetical protein
MTNRLILKERAVLEVAVVVFNKLLAIRLVEHHGHVNCCCNDLKESCFPSVPKKSRIVFGQRVIEVGVFGHFLYMLVQSYRKGRLTLTYPRQLFM